MDGISSRLESRECWGEAEEALSDLGMPGRLPAAAPWRGGESGFAGLVRTIETEIIPRLMLAHRGAFEPAVAPAGMGTHAPDADEVGELVRLVLAHEADVAAAYVETIRTQGASLEALYLDLLAPAARHLGELWVQDVCDFTAVTIGLSRLQRVARGLRPRFPDAAEQPERARQALLVAVPGEQHTFGLFMLGELFRRAGWGVWSEPIASSGELLEVVRREWFEIVGLSVSCETRLDGLASAILSVRRVSRNRAVGVMVGGRVFVDQPELVASVGADATATDGRQALNRAEELLGLLARRS
jgi:methanogenic corrinoid protein MtbC1